MGQPIQRLRSYAKCERFKAIPRYDVKKESDAALTLQTANEVVVVPKSEIDSRTPTKVSMMPDGAFEQMRIEEVRDLVAYLASPAQVALKK